jgi:hypothetical protein
VALGLPHVAAHADSGAQGRPCDGGQLILIEPELLTPRRGEARASHSHGVSRVRTLRRSQPSARQFSVRRARGLGGLTESVMWPRSSPARPLRRT